MQNQKWSCIIFKLCWNKEAFFCSINFTIYKTSHSFRLSNGISSSIWLFSHLYNFRLWGFQKNDVNRFLKMQLSFYWVSNFGLIEEILDLSCVLSAAKVTENFSLNHWFKILFQKQSSRSMDASKKSIFG